MNRFRRTLSLGLLSGLPLLPFLATRAAVAAQHPEASSQVETAFAALMDTFVPADDTPGMVELGLDKPIIEQISRNDNYLRVVTELLTLMDRLSKDSNGMNFAQAKLDQRTETLLFLLANDKIYASEKRLLLSLRMKALTAYYRHQAAFEMLAYHPPSQGGYPDYDRPPV